MPTSRERGSVKSRCFRVGVGLMLLVLGGCAVGKDLPNSTRTGRVQELKITFLNPGGNPAVSVGDEVRWFNADPRPLTITFTNVSEDRVSCQKNFKSGSSGSRGAPEITATLGRYEYASLCFRAPGLYAYDANLGYRGFLSAFLSSKPVSNGTPWTAKVIVETPPRDGALTSRRWDSAPDYSLSHSIGVKTYREVLRHEDNFSPSGPTLEHGQLAPFGRRCHESMVLDPARQREKAMLCEYYVLGIEVTRLTARPNIDAF